MKPRQNTLLETSNSIELTVAEQDVAAVYQIYTNYVKKLKEADKYKQFTASEKAQFDVKYKTTEEIRNGQRVIIIPVKSQEDTVQLIKQLEQQGIKYSLHKKAEANKPDAEPSSTHEEYRSPSLGRR